MAKFRFRLATLQKLRELHRDELRGKLAEAYQAQQVLEEQLVAIQSELEAARGSHLDVIQHEEIDVVQLLETQRFQSILQSQLATLEGQTKLLATEVERRRQAVVEADREVRVLEKLYERQHAQHRKQLAQIEGKQLDEIAAQRVEVSQPWA